MKSLKEQLDVFLNKQEDKDNCISAEEFENIFLSGFINQIQSNIIQFFNFELIDTNDGNCEIIARLKDNNETTCHILKEFFLKENLPIIKSMFGVPITPDVQIIKNDVIKLDDK